MVYRNNDFFPKFDVEMKWVFLVFHHFSHHRHKDPSVASFELRRRISDLVLIKTLQMKSG